MRIVLLNDSFSEPIFYRRWQLFAEKYRDVEVFLLTPYISQVYSSKKNTFGNTVINYGNEIEEDNFHIKLYRKKTILNFGGWSVDIKKVLLEIKPDIIYHIGTHFELSLIQILHIRNTSLKDTKVIAFSMRGPAYSMKNLKNNVKPFSEYLKRKVLLYHYYKYTLNYINKNCNAFFCHYPEAVQCFRDEGYNGPVYMQTQVGVNPELFHEDINYRREIREKYHLGDALVFGSATRFTEAKGIDVALEALPEGGNWKYLIMGAGLPQEKQRLMEIVKRRKIEDKVIFTGYINLLEMPKYWNAVDCVLHVPQTVYYWQETFSIALVQAMITKKAVIGSNSGSVPYQLGCSEMIVQEGNIEELRNIIQDVLLGNINMRNIGLKMYKRANECFSIYHLNELFYDTITQDIIQGEYDKEKVDMTKYKIDEGN